MPDNKLKDNEIVKALECCSEANNCGQCEYDAIHHFFRKILDYGD